MSNESKWALLLELAPHDIDDFMWMFEFQLEDGIWMQAYKHRATRRYLYLDAEGRAFDEVRPDRFDEVEPRPLLEWVLGGGP
jgi:hypothetical protein